MIAMVMIISLASHTAAQGYELTLERTVQLPKGAMLLSAVPETTGVIYLKIDRPKNIEQLLLLLEGESEVVWSGPIQSSMKISCAPFGDAIVAYGESFTWLFSKSTKGWSQHSLPQTCSKVEFSSDGSWFIAEVADESHPVDGGYVLFDVRELRVTKRLRLSEREAPTLQNSLLPWRSPDSIILAQSGIVVDRSGSVARVDPLANPQMYGLVSGPFFGQHYLVIDQPTLVTGERAIHSVASTSMWIKSERAEVRIRVQWSGSQVYEAWRVSDETICLVTEDNSIKHIAEFYRVSPMKSSNLPSELKAAASTAVHRPNTK